MKMRELPTGTLFQFTDRPGRTYVARGNGWYGSEFGYDGGPWHDGHPGNPRDVVPMYGPTWMYPEDRES